MRRYGYCRAQGLNTRVVWAVEPTERQSTVDCGMVNIMRTKFLLFSLAALPWFAGCNNANSEPESTPAVPPAAIDSAVPEATEMKQMAQPEAPQAEVINSQFAAPATIQLSPAATEVAKMARSGVDPSVMLTYVTNSVNTYNLGADEIVYLNDLGLPPNVVSAMIQHDQQIREASLNGAMAASPATPAPGGSVWRNNETESTSNVWQETAAAPAAAADVQTTVPPPPAEERPTEVTVNYFYDSLAPYGTWVNVAGYGRCWRPTVVVTSPGWRPYVHGGRWLWTDSGWYWYSDYSWGWAPFHYGRWFSDPYWGWCWVPGTIWGPSWVSWRYTDGYCGWAPLPPAARYYPSIGFTYFGRSCGLSFSFGLTSDCFTFVSYNRFYGRHYDRYCAPRHETPRIYNNSTVINNVIVGDNNTIINQGISPTRISAVTRSEIPRANVQQVASAQTLPTGRNEVLAASGSSVMVVRHEVPGGRPPTRGSASATTAPSTSSATPAAPTTSAPPTRGETVRQSAGPSPTQHGLAGNSPSSTRGNSSAQPSATDTPGPTSSSTRYPSGVAFASPTPRSTTTREPGALFIRGNPNPPTRAQEPAASSTQAASTTSATPWLNNNAGTRTPSSTWQSTVQNNSATQDGPVRPGRTPNSVFVRGNSANQVSTTAPAAPAAQPQTPRATQSPSVWANSQPSVRANPTPSAAPTRITTGNPFETRGYYKNPQYQSPAAAPVRQAPIRPTTPAAQPSQVTRIGSTPSYSSPSPRPSTVQSVPQSQVSNPRTFGSPPSRSAPVRSSAPAQSSQGNNSGSRPNPSRPGR